MIYYEATPLLTLDKCVNCTIYIPFSQDIVLRTSKCTALKIKLCKIFVEEPPQESKSAIAEQQYSQVKLKKQDLTLENGNKVKLIEVAEFDVPDYQQEGYMFSGGGDAYRDYCMNDLRSRKLKQYMWSKPKVKQFCDVTIKFTV